MLWLADEVSSSYGVTGCNKFIIAKWRADEFFFQLYQFALNEIYKFIY